MRSLNGFWSSRDVEIRVRCKIDGMNNNDDVTRVGVDGNSSAKVGIFEGIERAFIAGRSKSSVVLSDDSLISIY